jgi:hypothetical protein
VDLSEDATGPAWAPLRSPRRRLNALRSLCRLLRVRAVPDHDWSSEFPVANIEWDDVVNVAVELWLAPSLCFAVDRQGTKLPPDVAERLREYFRVNTLRNLRFRQECTEAVEVLNGIGVVPLLLKGGASLVDGSAQALGERFMNDVDIGVPAESIDVTVKALGAIGYRPWESEPGVHPFEVSLVKRGAPGAIDVHIELGVRPIPSLLSMADAWSAGTVVSIGIGGARIMSPTHQVLHNVLHSIVQDMDHLAGTMPLRQLVTLARLEQVHGELVEWAIVQRAMAACGQSSALRDHLWLAHQLVGMPLPAPIGGGVGERFHETRAMANFSFVRAAHLQRRVLLGLERRRLDDFYGHGNRPLKLMAARVRHATHIVRRDGFRLVREVAGHSR